MLDRSLVFRDARAEDADKLAELGRDTFVEAFGALYDTRDLKQFLNETHTPEIKRAEIDDPEVEIRLAAAQGKLTGYCKIGAMKLPFDAPEAPILELHQLYVREVSQGVGVGRILLDWAIDRAKARGAAAFYLGVWENNQRAIAVYESRGFEIVGAYQFPVGEARDNEKIMRLPLA